jgi:hypothetical protein
VDGKRLCPGCSSWACILLFFYRAYQASGRRLGTFDRIAGPGLNFKVPLLEKKVYVEDLNAVDGRARYVEDDDSDAASAFGRR